MIELYHHPQSRAASIHYLLEELGVPYTLKLVDFNAPEGVPESYRAIHPHKKVPALVHDGVVITERAAITIYLADRFPEAGLAPKIDAPNRGPYLTWLVYADSVFDPALAMRIKGFAYDGKEFSFGSYEDMIRNVERRLAESPFIAGDTFTAADTQLASGLGWATFAYADFPKSKVFADYLARVQARPAHQRYLAKAYGG